MITRAPISSAVCAKVSVVLSTFLVLSDVKTDLSSTSS